MGLFTNIAPYSERWRDLAMWHVHLNNDTHLYQNDDLQNSSWLDLKHYLDKNRNIYITKFYFSFRDNIIEIAADTDAVFFSKKLLTHNGGFRQDFYLGGKAIFGQPINVKHYIVPELSFSEEDDRDFYTPTVRRGLIVRPEFIDSFKDLYYDTEI